MTAFRNVPTFHLDDHDGSMAYVNLRDQSLMTFEFDCSTLNVEKAKRLRDWLIEAIPDSPTVPCDHSQYRNAMHGRYCPCGVQMWDAGD